MIRSVLRNTVIHLDISKSHPSKKVVIRILPMWNMLLWKEKAIIFSPDQ
jgi:hypothetical protein